jgi:hypothetical protein
LYYFCNKELGAIERNLKDQSPRVTSSRQPGNWHWKPLTSWEDRLNKNVRGILAAIVVAAAIAAPVIAGDKRTKGISAKCHIMLMSFDKKSKSCRN